MPSSVHDFQVAPEQVETDGVVSDLLLLNLDEELDGLVGLQICQYVNGW
jgi:hypothetical protein